MLRTGVRSILRKNNTKQPPQNVLKKMNNKNYTTLLNNNSNRIKNNSNSRNMIYNQINNMNSVSRVLGTTSQMHNKRMYHSIDDRAPVIDGNVHKNEEPYSCSCRLYCPLHGL